MSEAENSELSCREGMFKKCKHWPILVESPWSGVALSNFTDKLMMDSDILLPWEHQVCPKCLYQNQHAIWLVKYGCFEQFLHKFGKGTEPVVVVIVHETMEMVRLRPLPRTSFQFRGSFDMCRFKSKCQRGLQCNFPHSKVELDTWNAKKAILKGTHLRRL